MIEDHQRADISDFDSVIEMINVDRVAFEACMDAIIADLASTSAALQIFDPAPNAPLSLAEAVCLPELGGVLYRWTESEPSTTITVKTLRLAIERGELATTRLNTKNIHVTRRQIQEWIASCQDIKKNPISLNVQLATASRASSLMQRRGSSTMEHRERARDAALMILKELK